jgi:hypothetical protein
MADWEIRNVTKGNDCVNGTVMFAKCIERNRAGFQYIPAARAAVGGMSYEDLMRGQDFTRAVKSIAQECRVNVDIAKLMC